MRCPPRAPMAAGLLLLCAGSGLGPGCGRPRSAPAPRRAVPAPAEPVRRGAALQGLGARYTVRFDDPAHHLLQVDVEAALGPGEAAPEAWFPVWTPGSYLVREHERHVERFEAFDATGRPLPVRKTAKNRWRIEGTPSGAVRYRYVLYAHELSVRTAFLADDFGFFEPAALFVALSGRERRPVQVRFELPEGWALRCVGASAQAGETGRLRAEDFEALLEQPCLLGPVREDAFEVDGVPHALAYVGRTERWDRPRAVRDVRRIVQAERDLWGGLPYRRYTLLQVLERPRGMSGLEHAEGALLMAPPLAMRRPESYRDWLGLVAHELFHAWNVKRLRPAELRHYELQQEQPTSSLWVAEGLTSYYEDLMLVRAGLLDEQTYLKRLSAHIQAVQRRPGRAWQSLAEASWDAWIKYYRPDEQSPNATVSYYRKGAVVGWLLDATIREATGGRRSLDDAMRLAWRRFGDGRGYTPAQFREVLEEVAGRSLRDFYAAYVEGTAELDYGPALRWFGLRFAGRSGGPGGAAGQAPPAGWLGVELRREDGALRLRHVLREGPGWRAGLSAGDELLAIDGYRVREPDEVERLLRRLRPGEQVAVTVARRSRLRTLRVRLGAAPSEAQWQLEPDPAASGVQRAHRAEWLASAAAGASVVLGVGEP